MSTPSPRSVAGGAHYHHFGKLTAKWEAFRTAERRHATRAPEARARTDERRQDADKSAHPPT